MQDAKHIDIDLISLHDYSKSKQKVEEFLPTLLGNLNKFNEKLDFIYSKPQEITIFQVYTSIIILFYHINIVFCFFFSRMLKNQ
jgi:hypothetical protein